MQDIFALPIEELQDLFVAAGLKKFRAKQVFQWLYQKSVFDFAAMHNLSKADIAVLQEKFTVLPHSLEILREQNSSDGMTSKLLRLQRMRFQPGRLRYALRFLCQRPEGCCTQPDGGRNRGAGLPVQRASA